MSYADNVFIANCNKILNEKNKIPSRAKWENNAIAHCYSSFGIVNRYDLSKEFPIITLRETNFKSAIDEILWIWQKKSNNIADLNSKIWNSWADENGTIGKAYGYQLGKKYIFEHGTCDQVDNVLYNLKHNPHNRRIITNIYNFQDLNEMQLYPCAYEVIFNVKRNKLSAILVQRSQDFLVANNWNVVQYAILIHMFAQVSGLDVGELVHVISDAHIYDRHVSIVESLLEKNQYKAPKLKINKKVNNFYDFKVEDFELIDYKHSGKIINIPVAE